MFTAIGVSLVGQVKPPKVVKGFTSTSWKPPNLKKVATFIVLFGRFPTCMQRMGFRIFKSRLHPILVEQLFAPAGAVWTGPPFIGMKNFDQCGSVLPRHDIFYPKVKALAEPESAVMHQHGNEHILQVQALMNYVAHFKAISRKAIPQEVVNSSRRKAFLTLIAVRTRHRPGHNLPEISRGWFVSPKVGKKSPPFLLVEGCEAHPLLVTSRFYRWVYLKLFLFILLGEPVCVLCYEAD